MASTCWSSKYCTSSYWNPLASITWPCTDPQSLTKHKLNVLPREEPGEQLWVSVEDTGEPKVLRLFNSGPETPNGCQGEVDHSEGWVTLLRTHDIRYHCVVSELILTVQERVTKEMDVGIVARQPTVKDKNKKYHFQLLYNRGLLSRLDTFHLYEGRPQPTCWSWQPPWWARCTLVLLSAQTWWPLVTLYEGEGSKYS